MQRKRARALKGKSRRLKDTRPKNIVRIPMMEDPLSTDLLNREPSGVNHESSVNQRDVLPSIVISCSSRPASSSSRVPDDSVEHESESSDGESTEDRETIVESKPVYSGFARVR